MSTAAAIAATGTAIAAFSAISSTTGGSRAGHIYGEPTAVVVLAVQTLDRRLSFVVIRHFNEPEPATAAGRPIAQYLSGTDQTVLLK